MADGYLVENYSTISRILFSYVFDRVHICKGNLNAYETRQQLELNLMVALKLEIISWEAWINDSNHKINIEQEQV